MNNLSLTYISIKFKKRSVVHNGNTRGSNGLEIRRCNTAVGHRTSRYRPKNIWINLGSSLKAVNNIDSFKCKLRYFSLSKFLSEI